MILENILIPFFGGVLDGTSEHIIKFCSYALIWYLTYIIIKFVCRGVIRWYKWFLIS